MVILAGLAFPGLLITIVSKTDEILVVAVDLPEGCCVLGLTLQDG